MVGYTGSNVINVSSSSNRSDASRAVGQVSNLDCYDLET